jgi:hypothetical protein
MESINNENEILHSPKRLKIGLAISPIKIHANYSTIADSSPISFEHSVVDLDLPRLQSSYCDSDSSNSDSNEMLFRMPERDLIQSAGKLLLLPGDIVKIFYSDKFLAIGFSDTTTTSSSSSSSSSPQTRDCYPSTESASTDDSFTLACIVSTSTPQSSIDTMKSTKSSSGLCTVTVYDGLKDFTIEFDRTFSSNICERSRPVGHSPKFICKLFQSFRRY